MLSAPMLRTLTRIGRAYQRSITTQKRTPTRTQAEAPANARHWLCAGAAGRADPAAAKGVAVGPVAGTDNRDSAGVRS